MRKDEARDNLEECKLHRLRRKHFYKDKEKRKHRNIPGPRYRDKPREKKVDIGYWR